MRYSMCLHLEPKELESTRDIELNVGRHISIVNDIFSFEKELKASKTAHEEGALLCSAVNILSSEVSISYSASKRVLWTLCREYEALHDKLVRDLTSIRGDAGKCRPVVRLYLKGLEYQMSGNELWSSTTKRYQSVS